MTTGKAAKVDPALVALVTGIDAQLAERPSDGVLLYQRASVMLAVGGTPAEAMGFVERLEGSGWDIPLDDRDFGELAKEPKYREIGARIAARAVKVHRSEVAFTVPGKDLIPEGIAVDAETGTFYLSSLRHRTIVAFDAASGVARPFVPEGHGGLFGVTGIKVDRKRGVLWAASHASRSMLGYQRVLRERGGVYAFALTDGSVRRRIQFSEPGEHLANDLAIASDGTVYLTDSTTGALYRVPPDRDVLERILPAKSFDYPNGLALADDHRLYVADALGVALVDLDTRTSTRLTSSPLLALGGIDGMVLDGNRLLAVQSSIGRPRIVAITVDGARATGLTVLENSPEVFEIPTTTCLYQGALYTIANSQIRAFGPDGLRPGVTLADPQILRTPL